jgi:hypothetical protein
MNLETLIKMSSFVLFFTNFYANCPPFQEAPSGNPILAENINILHHNLKTDLNLNYNKIY